MERKNIVHRDLKPENILIGSEELEHVDVRIADFGFAIEHEPGKQYVRCGTPGYIAPEIL
jgi:serine/threonine protein kinase